MILSLVMIAGLAAADDPSVTITEPPAITAPNWLTPPQGDDLANLYPVAACAHTWKAPPRLNASLRSRAI
jgi:hypothetical protein